MKKEYKIDVLLKKNDMSRFLIRHNYSRFGGVFGVMLSLAALAWLIAGWSGLILQQRAALIFLALSFTVIQPAMLWSKGKKQLKQDCFQKPFHYEFDENEIRVSQEEYHQEFGWEQIRKAVLAKDAIYVYMTKMSAFIIPKHECEKDYIGLAELIHEKTKRSR